MCPLLLSALEPHLMWTHAGSRHAVPASVTSYQVNRQECLVFSLSFSPPALTCFLPLPWGFLSLEAPEGFNGDILLRAEFSKVSLSASLSGCRSRYLFLPTAGGSISADGLAKADLQVYKYSRMLLGIIIIIIIVVFVFTPGPYINLVAGSWSPQQHWE